MQSSWAGVAPGWGLFSMGAVLAASLCSRPQLAAVTKKFHIEFTVRVNMWVCLEMGYIPNYNHLIGIMIINHWVQWGTLFSDTPMWVNTVTMKLCTIILHRFQQDQEWTESRGLAMSILFLSHLWSPSCIAVEFVMLYSMQLEPGPKNTKHEYKWT